MALPSLASLPSLPFTISIATWRALNQSTTGNPLYRLPHKRIENRIAQSMLLSMLCRVCSHWVVLSRECRQTQSVTHSRSVTQWAHSSAQQSQHRHTCIVSTLWYSCTAILRYSDTPILRHCIPYAMQWYSACMQSWAVRASELGVLWERCQSCRVGCVTACAVHHWSRVEANGENKYTLEWNWS